MRQLARVLLVVLGLLGFSSAQAPQGAVLLQVNDDGSATVIGQYQGGRWLEAEQMTRLEARDYQVFGPAGRVNRGRGEGGLIRPPDVCDWNRLTRLELLEDRPYADWFYAVSAPWNPQPRPVTALQPNEVYRKTVADELAKKGLRSPVVRVQQALRADLDGDGRDEVVLAANSPAWTQEDGQINPGFGTKRGDYGILLVRKLVSDTDLRVFVLDADVLTQDVKEGGMDQAQVVYIGALLDLDGDGRMEVVVTWIDYESGGTLVFRWDGRGFKKVLEQACGV